MSGEPAFQFLPFDSFQELSSPDFLNRVGVCYHPALIEKSLEKPLFEWDPSDEISLSITTKTAFDRNIAHCFKGLLILKKLVTPAQELDLETLLHEGIANAVLHGTLGISERVSLDATTLEIHEKLQNPLYAQRLITLRAGKMGSCVYVHISTPDGQTVGVLKHKDYFGRGLKIIQQIAPLSSFNDADNTLTIVLENS